MAHLITPLLFIGFFSPACRLTAVSANKKSNEHLISLRDYDFVGEDPRLKAALAERMKVLQGEVGLSDSEALRRGRRAPAPPDVRAPHPAFKPKPDYLHSKLNFPQMVNVSLDYAELYNASELISEMNVSWHPPAPAPGLRGAPAPGSAPAGPEAVPTPGLVANPFPGPGGRRQVYHDPFPSQYNFKLLDIMKQCIYATQRKILEIDHVITRYEPDPRFRMAYIYNRLDEWLHKMRTLYWAIHRYRYWPIRVKRVIWYYEHALRINIDITYSIENLIFLHNEYMKSMEILVPTKKRKELWKKKKKKKN